MYTQHMVEQGHYDKGDGKAKVIGVDASQNLTRIRFYLLHYCFEKGWATLQSL